MDREKIMANQAGVYALHCALSAVRMKEWMRKVSPFIDRKCPDLLAYPATDFLEMVPCVLFLHFPDWYLELKHLSVSEMTRLVSETIYPFEIDPRKRLNYGEAGS